MILFEGFLTKSPPKFEEEFFYLKRWKRRYFELKRVEEKLILEYRVNKTNKALKGVIDLKSIEYLVNNFPILGQRKNLFAIKVNDHPKSRIFYFDAKSVNEFDNWIQIFVSTLNMIPTAMDMNRSKELIVAGFFAKSSIKDFKEYCEMFVNSLAIFVPKGDVGPLEIAQNKMNVNENLKLTSSLQSVPRKECRRFIDDRNLTDENCLPTRCTSTLSSDSSCESSSEDTESEKMIKNIPKSIYGRYMDSNNLELKPALSHSVTNTLAKSDHIVYCPIDTAHTEALYQLNKRLGPHEFGGQ